MKFGKLIKIHCFNAEIEDISDQERKAFLDYAKRKMTKRDIEDAKISWAIYDCVKILYNNMPQKKRVKKG